MRKRKEVWGKKIKGLEKSRKNRRVENGRAGKIENGLSKIQKKKKL